jgi:NAD(P)-dependent dehydrogenase (short-subunit alcohol dehydrogenase family)
VIVTAAASGIGRTIAESFLDAGARVHICDLDAAALAAFAAEHNGLSTTVANVADPTAVDRLFDEAVATLGGLDVLVNNAGVGGPVLAVESIPVEDWSRTLAVNLDAQFYGIRRAVPLLKEAGGGSIVCMASTAGLYGCPWRTPYAASKWAVIGLAKSVAAEAGTFGVRVNAICPGSVAGERIDRVIEADAKTRGVSIESIRESYLKQSSMRAFIDPVDIAELILFVCSDAGAKISGQTLTLDGNTETFL